MACTLHWHQLAFLKPDRKDLSARCQCNLSAAMTIDYWTAPGSTSQCTKCLISDSSALMPSSYEIHTPIATGRRSQQRCAYTALAVHQSCRLIRCEERSYYRTCFCESHEPATGNADICRYQTPYELITEWDISRSSIIVILLRVWKPHEGNHWHSEQHEFQHSEYVMGRYRKQEDPSFRCSWPGAYHPHQRMWNKKWNENFTEQQRIRSHTK